MRGLGPLSAVLLVAAAVMMTGCAAGTTPQQRFDARVRQFGMPGYVDAPTSDGNRQMSNPKHARQAIADSPEHIFYYLDRNEQVAFLPGKPPERGPINPAARRVLDQIPAEEKRIRGSLPEFMKQAREGQNQNC